MISLLSKLFVALFSNLNKIIWGYSDQESFSKRRHFLRYLNMPSNFSGKIMDLGCGPGYLTCFLAERFPQAEFIGVDVKKDDLAKAEELAKSKNLKNVKFQYGTALALDFPGQTFDRALSTQVLEHIPYPQNEKYFAEINRVLKPTGYFILDIPGDFFVTYSFPVLRFLSKFGFLRRKYPVLDQFHQYRRYPAYEKHEHMKPGFSPWELYTLTKKTNLSLQRFHYTFKRFTAPIFELKTLDKKFGNLLLPFDMLLYCADQLFSRKGLNLTCQFYKIGKIPPHVLTQKED